MADPVTPSPEDVERMIERLRAKRRRHDLESGGGTIDATGKATWWTNGEVWQTINPDGPDAADMLAALSAIGGDK